MNYSISKEAIEQLVKVLDEQPYKYAASIIRILQESLKVMEVEKIEEKE